jgi:hypothetical protein
MNPLAESQFEDAEEGSPVNEWIGGMLGQGASIPQHEQPDAQSPSDNVSVISTDTSDGKVSKPVAVDNHSKTTPVTLGNSSVSDNSTVEDDDISNADSGANPLFPFNFPIGVNGNDVLCGRGKGANNFIGNRRFRDIVMKFRETYTASSRRADKRNICLQIIEEVKSLGGRFLVKNEGRDRNTSEWTILTGDKILVKVSQALREGVAKWNKATQKFNEAKAKQVAALSTTPAMSLLAEISSIRPAV